MTLMMVFCLVPYRSMVETWLLAKVWHTPLCLVQILCAGPMSSYCSEPLICFSMWCVDSTDSWWLWWLDFIRIFFAILAADLPSPFPWLYRVVILLWWIHIHKRNMSIHGCQTVEIICYVFIWNSPLSKISFLHMMTEEGDVFCIQYNDSGTCCMQLSVPWCALCIFCNISSCREVGRITWWDF